MNLKSFLSFLNANKLIIIISLVSIVLCIFNIYGYPIYILDEARNAEAAREMFTKGDFIVPTFNNALRTDKPPLHYFFMMLGYKVFGINAFGARFFSSVFGALTIITTYLFIKKIKNVETALVTVCILVSAVFFIQEFHLSVPDPYLIFFINLSLFSFLYFYRNKRKGWLLLAYFAVAMGFLAKGPIALAIVGLSCLLFLILRKDISLKTIFSFRPLLGLLFVAALVFPWFYEVHKATNGAWTEGFFINHNINRFESKMEGHGGPFVITWLFILLGLMPFSVLIIQAFYFSFKKFKQDVFITFGLSVCLVVIGIFTLSSTRLPNYTMPCYPFLAALIASYLIDFYKKSSAKRKLFVHISFVVLLLIAFALPIGGYIALSLEAELKSIKELSFILVIVPVGITIAYLFFKEDAYKNSFATIVGTWVLLAIFLFGVIYPRLIYQNPVYASRELLRANSAVVVFKRMDSAFPFNYNRTFKVLQTTKELREYLKLHPETYIISNDRKVKKDLLEVENLMLLMEHKALFENHKTVIYKQVLK
ncbi:dolichyl-phosphate-mannose--protein mannosyltransferase [Neptunitalea chrysea]|uniref:Dolichyl-phosphate-mannose--protein mannosyltransferase n=1 Tax=Neptunitalea chrysea TaxID=1647581 RepID=A0A9W6EWZ6_9FLAO|nr:glycosyltransferase family 39 protein [Neptunitalea chrysea]GLB54053.1 dolichyl-phosphate-mannose--protein mannosyltransferase [Neptunitalea chrysea]